MDKKMELAQDDFAENEIDDISYMGFTSKTED
jgi:hypothetical protein